MNYSMSKKALLLFLLAMVQAGFGQAPQTLIEVPRLDIVYPNAGDTLNFQIVRFSGSVQPATEVRLQGRPVKVYPNGAFAGLVEVREGWNTLVFEADESRGRATREISVFREFDRNLPAIPTVVDGHRIWPAEELHVSERERVEVGFVGSPGGTAYCALHNVAEPFILREKVDPRFPGLRGVYVGEVPLSKWDDKILTPRFLFEGKDGTVFQFAAPGRVHVMDADMPLLGVTRDSVNFILEKPGGEIIFGLPPALTLAIVNRRNGFYKVDLAGAKEAYIDTGSIRSLPAGQRLQVSLLDEVHLHSTAEWSGLNLRLTAPVPFRIIERPRRSAVEITLFRTSPAGDLVLPVASGGLIRLVTVQKKSGDRLVLKIALHGKQLWGYRTRYRDGVLQLQLRHGPAGTESSTSPLQGVRIVIDPGHGGIDTGGTGSTRLAEKTANLALALDLEAELSGLGAATFLTRSSDLNLGLDERNQIALEQQPTIFISLHHNSIAPDVDPLRPRGAATFYTFAFSKPLAEKIYDRLHATGLGGYGVRKAHFAVTRQPDYLAVLIEGAFLTHPEDEMSLLDADFRRRMASAIAQGVRDFVTAVLPR